MGAPVCEGASVILMPRDVVWRRWPRNLAISRLYIGQENYCGCCAERARESPNTRTPEHPRNLMVVPGTRFQ